ncbi:MAG: hypothetical protein LKJ22_01795 [Liquorilactobacillus nagelii]|jgi:anion-transporting  ArsA/GET3 family ATPase|uniref:hypothetical protein n=1 Tax=Liquorilactobacillus nagelii TaxID=82688 RepID=UPI00242DD129|nr:hypothetical protein [Liquorilactobacillus nagelii]MCI1920639.1 hypothetical protein [Liquorilactobacillus nagelii]
MLPITTDNLAVLNDDPQNALLEYKGRVSQSKNFGNINTYFNEKLEDIFRKNNMAFKTVKGIRTVFGLSANSQILKKRMARSHVQFRMWVGRKFYCQTNRFFNHIIAIKKN